MSWRRLTVSTYNENYDEWEDTRQATPADLVEILPTLGAIPVYRTSVLAGAWAKCEPDEAEGWVLRVDPLQVVHDPVVDAEQ